MPYKIVYLEDQSADSAINDLIGQDLNAVLCIPTAFKTTIDDIDSHNPDLILMDFRLMEVGTGEVNAPAFAQYYRSLMVDDPKKSIPIVLLSNDDNIRDFYKDFTSHDLFDFSINKSKFTENLEKYTSLMKELIESYQQISTDQSNKKSLVDLLKIPAKLKDQIDPRIETTLQEDKFITNVYMASRFILNDIVKPIGVLIGEDVLAARVGVSKDSNDWPLLCENLNDFSYQGIYSKTYKRWWAEGVEMWWNTHVAKDVHLRRISSANKLQLLQQKYPLLNLKEVTGASRSVTRKFWTICHKNLVPVDPSEAFQAKPALSKMPWIEHKYYSYETVRGNENISKLLTDIERTRFKQLAREPS